MLSSLLAFALRQRVLVVVMACILTAGGIYAFRTIAIDAFPDVTTVLVQVVTKVPGMSPAEVERFVTFPMELQLMGAPGLTDIRSFSKVGLSMITVVFKDDIDIYLARQVVLERILEIQELLPPGSSSQLVPNTTGLGEVYQFYLEGRHDNDKDFVMSDSDLMERRTIEDWVIRPLLKGLPDVVDVNSLGGFVKQYQVMVEPGLLRKYGLSLHDVFDAVAKNNANAGGNILEKPHRRQTGGWYPRLRSGCGGGPDRARRPARRRRAEWKTRSDHRHRADAAWRQCPGRGAIHQGQNLRDSSQTPAA